MVIQVGEYFKENFDRELENYTTRSGADQENGDEDP